MLQKTVPANGENGRQQAAEEAARQASLTYVSDTEPGIRRRRAGTGFSFVGPNGKPVTDKRTLARIQSLVIPPAWTDVWICRRPGRPHPGDRPRPARPQAVPLPSALVGEPRRGEIFEPRRLRPRAAENPRADRRRPAAARTAARARRRLDRLAARQHDDPRRQRGLCARQQELRADHAEDPACRGRRIEAALRLQGQVRQGMEAEARRPAHGEDHPQHPGTAGPASLPVHQRRRRAARGRARRTSTTISARPAGERFQLEAFPHMGRHGAGARAVCRTAVARYEGRRRTRHERR